MRPCPSPHERVAREAFCADQAATDHIISDEMVKLCNAKL